MTRTIALLLALSGPAYAGGMAPPIIQGEVITKRTYPVERSDGNRTPPVHRPPPECRENCGPVDPPDPEPIYEPACNPCAERDAWVAAGKPKRP